MPTSCDVSNVEEVPSAFVRPAGSRSEETAGKMGSAESADMTTDVAPHLSPARVAKHAIKQALCRQYRRQTRKSE